MTREEPDRGHAWVIALAACVITMILSGISKMVGILYVAVIETYGVSRQEATLPFTFRRALRGLAGPIVGIMGQKFGIRTVTFGGGVVAALGAGLSFFAPSVTWLTICWGVIHGLGDAFANTLFQVVVSQYFEKYRSTASGIALSGACVGSVIFSFLIEALRDAYGLQGTFLILAGVILHVLPAAILLKSPTWFTNGAKPDIEMKELKKHSKNNPMCLIPDKYVKTNDEKRMSVMSLNPCLLEKIEMFTVTKPPIKSHSTTNLVESLEKKLEGERGFNNLAVAMEKENNLEKTSLENRLNIQNIYSTSKDRIPSVNNLSQESCIKKQTPNGDVTKKVDGSDKGKGVLQSLKTIARLYTNPVFLLISACMSTYAFVLIPIMTSMVDYSKDKGLPETVGKYLIHAMAIGDLFGRLCLGWVTDKDYIGIPRYMTLTLVLQGIFIILVPFAFNLASFMVLLAFYSMTAGSMMIRLPVLVLKHVKKEEQSVAIGCYGFVSGMVTFGVPYLFGRFRDHFGSYDGMYFLLGGLSIVSGAFWLLEPVLVRLKQRLEERKENRPKV